MTKIMEIHQLPHLKEYFYNPINCPNRQHVGFQVRSYLHTLYHVSSVPSAMVDLIVKEDKLLGAIYVLADSKEGFEASLNKAIVYFKQKNGRDFHAYYAQFINKGDVK